jgi:hypothetical protein
MSGEDYEIMLSVVYIDSNYESKETEFKPQPYDAWRHASGHPHLADTKSKAEARTTAADIPNSL